MGYGDPGFYNPAETTNRFAGEPELVERLRAEMGRIVDAGRSR